MADVGGIDASIPLAAGRIGQGAGGNSLLANPSGLIDTMAKLQQMQLFPGQMQRQQQEIQQGDIGIQSGHLKLTNDQNAAVYSHLAPLLQKPDPQLSDVTSMYGMAAAGNLAVDRQVADAVKTFPTSGTADERRAWIAARVGMSGISPENRVLLNTPSAGPDVNVGSTIIPTTRGAALGPTPGQVQAVGGRPGAPFSLGLSPGEAATRVPTIDNNLYLPDGTTPNPNYGQPTTVPLGSITPPAGGMPAARPAVGGGTPSVIAAPAARPVGVLPSGMPPGADIGIKAANDAWANTSANVNTYQQRVFPIAQSLSILNNPNVRDVQTGPGAEAVNNIKAWLQTRAATFGWNAQTIAGSNFQELNKYLQQAVNAQPMAAGSDARLAAVLSGNPGTHINTLANVDVLKANLGLMRMEQAAALDFAARGAPNGQFNNFMRDWQTQHDPRAFVFDLLDKEKRAQLLESMKDKPQERLAFNRTLDQIEAHPELLNMPAMPH